MICNGDKQGINKTNGSFKPNQKKTRKILKILFAFLNFHLSNKVLSKSLALLTVSSSLPGLGLAIVVRGASVVRPVIRVAVLGISVGVVTVVETVSVVPVVTSTSQKQFYNYSLLSKLR